MKKQISISLMLCATSMYALSLGEAVNEVTHTNPQILQKYSYFNAANEDYKGSDSGYKPTVDYEASIGKERVKNSATNFDWDDGDIKKQRIVLKQNLYNGFGTVNERKAQKAKLDEAYYSYLESVDKVTLKTVESYLKILENLKLLDLAKENVEIHKKTFLNLKIKQEAGSGKKSDLDRAASRLSVAKSGYILAQNEYRNSIYNFQLMLGRFVTGDELKIPSFRYSLPDNLEAGLNEMYANHPTLKSAEFKVKVQQFTYEGSKKKFHPKVDFELMREWDYNSGDYEDNEDRYRAMVTLSYNLYNGGYDSHDRAKQMKLVHYENQKSDAIRREAVNGLELNWNGYRLLTSHLKYLSKNRDLMESVLDSYTEEFQLGKRTTIDLLNAKNEFYQAKVKLLQAEFKYLLFKYKLLGAMGVLYEKLNFEVPNNIDYETKYKKTEFKNYKDESLPLNYDIDKDVVNDKADGCPNSLDSVKVGKIGCDEKFIETYIDIPLNTGSQIARGVVKTKKELNLNKLKKGKILVFDYINFKDKSTLLTQESATIMREFITQLKSFNRNTTVEITIHSDDFKDEKKDYMLSTKRAYTIKKILLMNQIRGKNLVVFGSHEIEKKYATTYPNYMSVKIKDSYNYSSDKFEKIVDGSIVFQKGKSTLSNEVVAKLEQKIQTFMMREDVKVDVIVHCKEFADELKNIKMSQERAKFIKNIFIKKGLHTDSIIDFGMGNYDKAIKKNVIEFVVSKKL